jgi:hypothetical protein
LFIIGLTSSVPLSALLASTGACVATEKQGRDVGAQSETAGILKELRDYRIRVLMVFLISNVLIMLVDNGIFEYTPLMGMSITNFQALAGFSMLLNV